MKQGYGIAFDNSAGRSQGQSLRDMNREYYLKRFLQSGENVRSLWGSHESQEVRFSVLCRMGDFSGTRVLDVGCGFGDLYGHLQSRGILLSGYLGLDLVQETLAVARKRYPAAKFENRDLFELEVLEPFDWAVGSGLFTLTSPEWAQYVLQMVQKMFSLVRRGVGVNFLSSFGSRRDDVSHYAQPGQLVGMLASEVSPIFELIHSYRTNDFTVFLYKEPQRPRNS